STGLRVGEALALDHSDIVNGGSTLDVRKSVDRFGHVVPHTKTAAGIRQVDLCGHAAGILHLYASHIHKSGLLFPNRRGGPWLQSNAKRVLARRTAKGFHAFRRHRISWLREQNCLPDLLLFWAGHSTKGSMTATYSKLSRDLKVRLREAERVGLGFAIPGEERVANLPPDAFMDRAYQIVKDALEGRMQYSQTAPRESRR
ncbi:MAG TPA: site-specific integrase, partial [Candidatus Acidoferrales bacterium]|nr:site-specific integrase [Candidatus Acidoferrales bacterium]